MDDLDGWEIVRDAPVEEVGELPPPAAGRYVIALPPPALDGLVETRGRTRFVPRHETLALLLESPGRKPILVPVCAGGLILMAHQKEAPWLPQGWTMNVYPAGWTLPHLESWFDYAVEAAGVEDRGHAAAGADRSPSHMPTPRGLVAHAHLIVRLLALPDSPAEPRVQMDRPGCIADLRDVLAFFRRAMRDDERQPGQGEGAGHARARRGGPGAGADNAPAPLPDWVGEHFTRNQYNLLRLLWGKGEVPIARISQAIFSLRNGKEEALDKVKDRANKKLSEIDQHFEVITRRGEVYVLVPIEPGPPIRRRS